MAVHEVLTPDFLLYIGNKAVRVVLIIGGAVLFLRFLRLLVNRLLVLKPPGLTTFYFEEKRARTIHGLLQSITRYAVYFIAGVMVLQEFQVDTTSIIAGAGIIGLAIGVGAQSLIRDFITGFFIILEDQYAVGDYIVSKDMAGTVEEMGFRVTKLRDGNGVLHIIPNGEISRVSNHTRGHMQAVINVPVAYQADLTEVLELLQKACAEIGGTVIEAIEPPKVLGVVDLRPGELIIRIIAKTVPLEQVKVETALRQKIKLLFDEAHILPPPAGQPWTLGSANNDEQHEVRGNDGKI